MDASTLITGGTGFLGKYIVDSFVKDNLSITIFNRTINKTVDPNIRYIIGDLTKNSISLPSQAFHTIIHNAGLAHIISKGRTEQEAFFKVNTEGTKNLLSAIDSLSTLPKKIIFISTVAVYGKDTGLLIDEQESIHPISAYASSKAEAEGLIQRWCNERNIKYFILRLPLVVGENPPGNLGALLRSIRKGKYAHIKNNNAKKSMVLASDVAELVKHIDGPSGIYNLTDGTHPTINQLADAIALSINKKIKFTIPKNLLCVLSKIGNCFAKLHLPFTMNTNRFNKITLDLTFSDDLARKNLHWQSNSCIKFISHKGLTKQ